MCLCQTKLFESELFICLNKYSALNNLQRSICPETKLYQTILNSELLNWPNSLRMCFYNLEHCLRIYKVVADVLDCNYAVNKFEQRFGYFVHF